MVRSPDLSSPHFFRTQEHLDLRRVLSHLLILSILVGSSHECLEQRMRLQRLRLEFRMKLAPDKKRMSRNLHHLYISSIRSRTRNTQPSRHHRLLILTVKFVTMPVALADFRLPVNLMGQRPRLNLARPRSKPHRTAQVLYATQLAQLVNHAMWSRLIELTRIRAH